MCCVGFAHGEADLSDCAAVCARDSGKGWIWFWPWTATKWVFISIQKMIIIHQQRVFRAQKNHNDD